MRLAIPFLAALALVTLTACTGGDESSAEPVPVAERFLTEDEAPGSKPDPDETRRTTAEFDEFVALLTEASVDPDEQEMTEVFEDAGFESAGTDTRFFGDVHSPRESIRVVSSFIELGSEDGAASALDWLEADVRKPCPRSCAVRISTFDADDLSDGRGVHRVATAEEIERLGTTDEVPSESYWTAFRVGSLVYTVDLFGRPGFVSADQALDIATAYHDRLTAG